MNVISLAPWLRTTNFTEMKKHSKLEAHLAYQQRHTPLHELPHRPRISIQITTRKSLVSAIKERIVTLFEDDISNLPPLFPRGVHAGGVVSASVQEEYGACWCRL